MAVDRFRLTPSVRAMASTVLLRVIHLPSHLDLVNVGLAMTPEGRRPLDRLGEPSLIIMEQPRRPNTQSWGTTPEGPGIDLNVSFLLQENSSHLVRIDRVRVHADGITLHLSGHGIGTWPGRNAMRQRKEQILDVSVTFADGRSSLLNDSAGLKSGLGPMVTWAGGTWRGRGPANDEDFDQMWNEAKGDQSRWVVEARTLEAWPHGAGVGPSPLHRHRYRSGPAGDAVVGSQSIRTVVVHVLTGATTAYPIVGRSWGRRFLRPPDDDNLEALEGCSVGAGNGQDEPRRTATSSPTDAEFVASERDLATLQPNAIVMRVVVRATVWESERWPG